MTRKQKRVAIAGGVLVALLLLLSISAVLIVQSPWFFDQVRTRIVAEIEKATGGRVEIGQFTFDWKNLRAEVRNLVIHGTEPAGKPPLLRAARVVVGLKIVSLWKRDIDISSLDVERPQVYLAIAPGGRTNIPEPKIKSQKDSNAMETILNLAIGRMALTDGLVQVESRGSTPFDVRGEKVRAVFGYQALQKRYEGDVSLSPLDLRWPGFAPAPVEVAAHIAAEQNRIEIGSLKLSTGSTVLTAKGSLDDLNHPRGRVTYELRTEIADVLRILQEKVPAEGAVLVTGNAVYSGGSDFSVTGDVHGDRLGYRESGVRLSGGKLAGAVQITPQVMTARDLHLTAQFAGSGVNAPVSLRVGSVELKDKDLEARGVAVAALGGSLHGQASVRDFAAFNARGELAGFEIKRLVAIYNKEPLPWDGRLSGTFTAAGNLKRRNSANAQARIDIAPAQQGPPVRGMVAVNYDAARGVLDLGRSFVELPHSRLDFSGAVGTQLQVEVETRDLNDILPAVGASTVPLRIDSGAVRFTGTVTGKLDAPQVAGKLTTGRISYQGTAIDSLAADVNATPTRAQVSNVVAMRGPMRVTAEGSVALANWKPRDTSLVYAKAAIRSAPVEDLLALLKESDLEAMGTLEANAELTGTVAKPAVRAQATVTKGIVEDERFDRLAIEATYANRTAQITSGQLVEGDRRIDFSGSYQHEAADFAAGRVNFKLASNAMALEQFVSLGKARPGMKGNVTLSVTLAGVLAPAAPGRERFRLTSLESDIRGRGLQMQDQPLGDVRLTANTEGNQLHARLASDFANSRIRGEGNWRLDGNHAGTATVTFSRLDFQQLRAWVSPKQSANAFDIAGSAEGELKLEGPGLDPQLWRATLRIPKIEAGPVANGTLAAGRQSLTMRNEGPIVVSMANQVVTVESARLIGRSSDLSVSGKVAFQQRNPLDLKVKGRLDISILHDFDRDILSAGMIELDTTVRGQLAAPQVNGRMEMKDASFSIADVPNGISKANGVIAFTGDRATIQSLTGETGGGKVTITGFAGYGGGEPVFHINLSAEEVRVRYPEGVSTVADADLDLTGTVSRSMLSGTVTILRTGFNPQSDLSSILASSAEPVRTPAARTGFLGGLNFDVQIESSPDITFQSSLAEGLQMEANLRLRGTASNPAVLGRINISQGQIVFFGTKYTINQGSVAFYNPVKVEPVLNIDLETKARGIDVTLTVSGPINKLQLTPRSDPPLQFSEIVALLATGRAPTSDPTQLANQSASGAQSWQQMGASALLGQAIANPVAGRLQRFFGVSKLKIDPSLTGVENNPQARLTLEQQVTQDITFTYITNVTSSNPQVIRVEWAFARQWSVVAVRDENGLFGMDFFYKKRFK